MKNYYKPTPKKLRILGDTLLSIGTFITASAIASQNEWLAYTALGIGVIGKFFTNFFVDE